MKLRTELKYKHMLQNVTTNHFCSPGRDIGQIYNFVWCVSLHPDTVKKTLLQWTFGYHAKMGHTGPKDSPVVHGWICMCNV